ncbi:MAG TPA: hypothetical protein PLW79_00665 [Caldisericia bacterium]|nr:hypothetical protein [Caldisericia bacterium]HOL82424.1 hypothetical protein [Caldisericia bacterium]HPP43171.1 hypothetical protein [Caldisericia bacterium]
MKTIIISLKRYLVKVRIVKELFGIPKSSFYEMLKDKEDSNFL